MPSAVPTPTATSNEPREDVPPNEIAKDTTNTADDVPIEESTVNLSEATEPPNETDDGSSDDEADESMEVELTQVAAMEELEFVDDEKNVDVVNDAPVEEQPNDAKEKETDDMDLEENNLATAEMNAIVVETKNDYTVDCKEQKKLGEIFDVALDKLQERISASILALRSDEHDQAQNTLTDEKRKKSNAVFASLSEAAKETYHTLVRYGSKFDLSSVDSTRSSKDTPCLSESRRARLISAGKNIWMTVRGNPELFDDSIAEEVGQKGGGDYLAFEGRKHQAVAGGYVRAIAAQLVFLDYIDTRCAVGSPPGLNEMSGESGRKPSVKELVFGLKVFSRAGKAILTHSKVDPQASYNTLSLAASCFHKINELSATNGEAAEELKDLLDEAFDAFSLLPNAASLFSGKVSDEIPHDWPSLVIGHLKQAKKLLDDFCNLSTDDGRLTVSNVAILQRYLPSLARLCYKHGSQLVKISKFDHASNALHIALDTTNSCLGEVRQALKKENDPFNEGTNRKTKGLQLQVLHNLEADLVVVSIEAFYVLSNIFQLEGKQEKALRCLEMIEQYMKEQKERDDELYVIAKSKVDKDFVFSESAIEGPKQQDKLDIKARASTVRANAKKRHAQEKSTLAFCRLMIYHKVQPHPSAEEELHIDKLIIELADLCNLTKSFNSSASSAQNSLCVVSYDGGDDHILTLTLSAMRSVHVRRILHSIRSGGHHMNMPADPYKVLLDKISKTDARHPFILLDRMNALLNARFSFQEHDVGRLDEESLHLARDFTASLKSLLGSSFNDSTSDSTLFADSTKSMRQDLFKDSKAYFARGLSLYHSSNAHTICAEYAQMLEAILRLTVQSNYSDFENTNAQLGEVIAIKAYALSNTSSTMDAYKAAQEAWGMVKSVDTFVNLFHCSLTYEIKHSTCDTLLELDTAISDLLLSGPTSEDILTVFPRLSNSCVENGKGTGERVLLGLQERWIKMLVASRTLHQVLMEKSDKHDSSVGTGCHSVFEVLRAYLQNFEQINTVQNELGNQNFAAHCETLLQVIETILGFIVSALRDTHTKVHKNRRKRKEVEREFVLIWEDDIVKKCVGNREDCVWVAEQLWNLANKLMVIGPAEIDTRKYSTQLFAGAHDFCLLSEEEEGGKGKCSCAHAAIFEDRSQNLWFIASLSKDFLDIDICSDKMLTPSFNHQEMAHCDISSEFSGQCLLLSAATAVDFITNENSLPTQEVKKLLRRSLHRLLRAQDELLLNSEDTVQKKNVNKMISLLTLRCLLGIGDDSLAHGVLAGGGLEAALLEMYSDESPTPTDHLAGTLQHVYLVACGAEEKKMFTFQAVLLRSCASHMSRIGKFVLKINTDQILTLAEIQRKVIQSASTAKVVIEMYQDVDMLVKKRKVEMDQSSTNDSFYSKDDLDWLAIEAYNQGVSITLLGDHKNAGFLFTSALNMIPLCSNEVQVYTKEMHAALSNSLSKHFSMGQSISSIANHASL